MRGYADALNEAAPGIRMAGGALRCEDVHHIAAGGLDGKAPGTSVPRRCAAQGKSQEARHTLLRPKAGAGSKAIQGNTAPTEGWRDLCVLNPVVEVYQEARTGSTSVWSQNMPNPYQLNKVFGCVCVRPPRSNHPDSRRSVYGASCGSV